MTDRYQANLEHHRAKMERENELLRRAAWHANAPVRAAAELLLEAILSTPIRISCIADASMPSNCFELRSGDQRLRVRWPDEATELDRWADDGGRGP
jgi:hypothetical protein